MSQASKVLLICVLLLTANRLWANDSGDNSQFGDDQESETSVMDSWHDGWQDKKKRNGWTWFGMGYESRHRSSGNHSNVYQRGTNRSPGGHGRPKAGGGRGH
ncbi:MAG: hypothetical protein P8179_18615 [Candidatus Thiodiazotropha sp.]